MSLGDEINDWPDIQHKSPYYFMRRSFAYGTALPTTWMVGGWFSLIGSGGLDGIYQNVQTTKNGAAQWVDRHLTVESIAALVLILGDDEED